jgi:hypothetical protein
VVVLTTNRGSRQSLVPLARHLDSNHETWTRLYADKAGVIWVRRTAKVELLAHFANISDTRVDFATLERYGEEDEVLAPPIPGGLFGDRAQQRADPSAAELAEIGAHDH